MKNTSTRGAVEHLAENLIDGHYAVRIAHLHFAGMTGKSVENKHIDPLEAIQRSTIKVRILWQPTPRCQ